ncbi:hypothetical protein HpCHN10_15460 [Helicobacter pylori]
MLEIFELVLVVIDLNKTEKLETEVRNSLKTLEGIVVSLNNEQKSMGLKHFKDNGIKIK